ncbi:Spo0B domain-containing protein [Paenibacillus lignilyticus]|uniref:Spo0B domain-containing protein n=1 Tax=Paenibacillus lignilyticus TaxID=1172615 RepID=A0ABS5C6B2_9BACL|nr:Spo0B domain-containing protein [Paenibacillus lignilyticus]MBP3961395.1 Spo0B domain-containing protein [Paenibacillus lignilyticus]
MNRIGMTKQFAAASLLVPAAAVFIWPAELWLLAVFTVWLVLVAAFWVLAERREQESRMARAASAMQQASIRTLNHHRHDWMNDLQVIYGYIRMGKADKTVQYVEQIRERMLTESKIAKLGIPSLVLFIQSFRTISHSLVIDVEIDGDVNLAELPLDGELAAESIVGIINAYRFAIRPGTGDAERLVIRISQDEQQLSVSFHCEGIIKEMDDWKMKCKRALDNSPLKLAENGLQSASVMLQAQLGK